MRKNIFIHFLKPDNVELYALKVGRKDIDKYYKANFHLMDLALRYSFLLSNEYCVIPPAFILESNFNFELLKRFKILFEYNKFLFPIRETSFYEFAKKKEVEYSAYQGQEEKYTNYSLNNLEKISSELNVNSLIHKTAKIGATSAKFWHDDITDLDKGLFDKLKLYHQKEPYEIKKVIKTLNFDVEELHNKAFVWQFVEDKLRAVNVKNFGLEFYVHSILQNYYIRSNIMDGDLALLTNAPFVSDNFFIQPDDLTYDFQALDMLFSFLGIKTDIAQMPVLNLMELKNSIEYKRFIEVFDFLIQYSKTSLETFKSLSSEYVAIENRNNLQFFSFVLKYIFKGNNSLHLTLSDTVRFILLKRLKPLLNFVEKIKDIGEEDSMKLLFEKYLNEELAIKGSEIINFENKILIKQTNNYQFINSNLKFSHMENKFENSTFINSNFVEGTLNMWKSNNVEFDNNDIEIIKLIDKHSASKTDKEELIKAVEDVKKSEKENDKKKPLEKLMKFFKENAGTIGKIAMRGAIFTYLAANGIDVSALTSWFE